MLFILQIKHQTQVTGHQVYDNNLPWDYFYNFNGNENANMMMINDKTTTSLILKKKKRTPNSQFYRFMIMYNIPLD